MLLIPVSYLVLKRMDKREMAWYTAPGLILGFTVISYIIALTIKGGSLSVNRAVVVEGQAGSPVFAGYGEFTLYSPRRTTYDLAVKSTSDAEAGQWDIVPNELSRVESLGSELTLEQNGGTIMRGVPVGLWDKRSYELPLPVSAGGAVDARVVMVDGSHVRVNITNNTKFKLHNCGIVNGDSQAVLGDLEPGKSAAATVKWISSAESSVFRLPGGNITQTTDASDTGTQQRIQLAMTQVLAANSSSSGYQYMNSNGGDVTTGKAPNVFVGWFDEPLMHVSVNGQDGHGAEANLLVVHLPMPQAAIGSIAADYNPFVSQPVLALESALQRPTTPGSLAAPQGGRR